MGNRRYVDAEELFRLLVGFDTVRDEDETYISVRDLKFAIKRATVDLPSDGDRK